MSNRVNCSIQGCRKEAARDCQYDISDMHFPLCWDHMVTLTILEHVKAHTTAAMYSRVQDSIAVGFGFHDYSTLMQFVSRASQQ